jgi:hypothetical protein
MARSFLIAVAALALLACSKSPVCRGEISHEDLVRLQARAEKGEQVCEELTRTRNVSVDDEGIVLDGSRIHVILAPNKRETTPPLSEILRMERQTWEAIHPRGVFVAPVDLSVPAEMEVGPGVTVASTIASVGYRQLTVHSGDITMKLDYWVNKPPDDARELVHVRYDAGTRGFVVHFDNQAKQRQNAADRDDVAKMLASRWTSTPGPRPRALMLRVPKGSTFHDALALARAFLALPELAGASVAFEIGGPYER